MIMVISGTKDSREIIRLIKENGYKVLATSVTDYGSELTRESGADIVLTGVLDRSGIVNTIVKNNIEAVIDATHPFAVEASRNAIQACKETGISYLRFERKPSPLPDDPLIHYSTGFEEAGRIASGLGDNIFYTAGVKGLARFLKGVGDINKKNIIVRVIPECESIRKCLECGIPMANIIAVQGPFSMELNKAMLREYRSDVIVTKESGNVGGTNTKVQAAFKIGIPIVVISRPRVSYPEIVSTPKEVIEWISRISYQKR
jgi:precorrin-6A/cobalt-precorrin-6A reductase